MDDSTLHTFINGMIVGFSIAILPVRYYLKVIQDRAHKKTIAIGMRMEKDCYALMEETTAQYRDYLSKIAESKEHRIVWTPMYMTSKPPPQEMRVFTPEELDRMNKELR